MVNGEAERLRARVFHEGEELLRHIEPRVIPTTKLRNKRPQRGDAHDMFREAFARDEILGQATGGNRAAARVAQHQLHAALHGPEADGGDEKTAKLHRVLGHIHAGPRRPDHILEPDPHALEVHGVLDHPPHAHGHLFGPHAQPGGTLAEQERGDAAIAAGLVEQMSGRDDPPRPSARADPAFAAMQEPSARAIGRGGGGDGPRIRPGGGFREGKRDQFPALGDRWNHLAPHPLTAMAQQGAQTQGVVDADEGRQVDIDRAELHADAQRVLGRETGTPELLGHLEAQQTVIPEIEHDVRRDTAPLVDEV